MPSSWLAALASLASLASVVGGVLGLAAVAGCAEQGGGHGHGAQHGSAPAASPPSHYPLGLTKAGLAAVEVAGAVTESALEHALAKGCYASCAAPSHCDPKSGLCIPDAAPNPASATGDGRFDPVNGDDATNAAAPLRCGGLCLPGERCVMAGGKQDCVAIEKLPR